ncbi:MAG: hypothetical protein ACFFFO_14910 [Candidatus Thorarchaeota archaeon]
MKTSSKILIVTLFLVLFTIPTLFTSAPVTIEANEIPVEMTQISQTGHKVLFDEAHCALGSAAFTPGNASLFAWILEEHGYYTDMNFDQPLDSGILSGVDVLILVFPMVALTANEITAVENFVQNGGGLLLVGTDNNPTWKFTSSNLNALSQTFGITFSTDTSDSWLGQVTDLGTHHLTQDVSSIHSNVDYKLRGTILTVESPASTIIERNGNPVVAVAEFGSGRVVGVGALAPFLEYREGTNMQVEKDDLFQFSLNTVDWLVGNSPRKVTVPKTAVIPVGSGPSLSVAEVEGFRAYTGTIHDHTTHSDGADTPAEMLWAAVSRGQDYFVMTDHSYEAPNPLGVGGVTGGFAMKAIAEANGLDIEIFVGAELSRGHHSMAFPLTENIYTDTQEGMIAGARAQGAFISLCHPTIAEGYLETYELYDALGYDAIEVTDDSYSHGLWDEGYTKNFYGGNDGHQYEDVGKVLNIIFVDNPTGPDGRLSAMDIIDAIMNKRVVILDKYQDIIYGQQLWLDRYFDLMDTAETDIAASSAIVESVSGVGTSLAELYLRDAQTAYNYRSPQRAIYASANASTLEALNIVLNVTSPDPRFIEASSTYNLTLNVTNMNSDAIQFNMSRYFVRAMNSNCTGKIVTLPAEGFELLESNFTTPLVGYMALVFNIKEINTTANLSPVIYGIGALTNVWGHSPDIERDVDGTYVTFKYPVARGDSRFITAVGFYDDGSGWQNKTASVKIEFIEGTVGPYPKGTVIKYTAIVYDFFGGVFVFPELEFTVTTDPLEPTTTTTTETGPPIQIDPLLLLGITGGAIVVIIVVVFLNKRKASM